MTEILTVCVGNICRSPMAEGLLKHALPDVSVRSAGIGALIGHKADPIAVALMAEHGIDISNHIARQISQEMCRNAEIILVMDAAQKNYILSTYPGTRGKIFKLGIDDIDIPDPYRETKEIFEGCLELVDRGVSFWAQRIEKII